MGGTNCKPLPTSPPEPVPVVQVRIKGFWSLGVLYRIPVAKDILVGLMTNDHKKLNNFSANYQ